MFERELRTAARSRIKRAATATKFFEKVLKFLRLWPTRERDSRLETTQKAQSARRAGGRVGREARGVLLQLFHLLSHRGDGAFVLGTGGVLGLVGQVG